MAGEARGWPTLDVAALIGGGLFSGGQSSTPTLNPPSESRLNLYRFGTLCPKDCEMVSEYLYRRFREMAAVMTIRRGAVIQYLFL